VVERDRIEDVLQTQLHEQSPGSVASTSRDGQDRHGGCMHTVGITSTGIAFHGADARWMLGNPAWQLTGGEHHE
jgi:hypothetical protein